MSVYGTVTHNLTRGFSWQLWAQHTSVPFPGSPAHHCPQLQCRILTLATNCPTSFSTGSSSHAGCAYPPASPLDSTVLQRGTGILTCCPSATPFGLALGPTNPTRINLPSETLDLRRDYDSHIAFTLLMPTFSLLASSTSCPYGHSTSMLLTERSPTAPRYTKDMRQTRSFGGVT